MNCPKCGNTVADDKNFCAQCGTPMRASTLGPSRTHMSTSTHPRPADMARTRPLPVEPAVHTGARRLYRADIVVVFDCTGSMGPYIEGIKNTVIGFSRDLEDHNIEARLGLVEYRDLKIGEPTNVHGFARAAEEFRSWVAGLDDHGGGDEPESAIDALCSALEMPFREDAVRIVTLITDASYHEPSETGRTMNDVCRDFRTRRIVAYVIGPDLPGYARLADCMGGILFNIESDPEGFRRIVQSLGKSISQTVPRMTDVCSAADRALGRTRVR